jgi:pseudaminic acid synthase
MNKIKKSISILGREIGVNHPPYVIAELSANHNGSLENAYMLIEQAKKVGADAVKLQTYTPDTITLNSANDDFRIYGGLWHGRYLYELYQEAHTPWDWHKPLFDYARNLDITIFSSPFDNTAVDLLEDLGSPAYKIASFEAVDLPLIKYVASTGKPMIISTGMANAEEIEEAIDAAFAGGCKQLAILHCVSGYPASPDEYNLRTIKDMIKRFGLVTGLSDHTLGSTVAIASVAMGASIIEKHFTLNRHRGGPDDAFSLEPKEMLYMCQGVKTAWQALGHIDYGCKSSEQGNIKFRRSLYYVKDLRSGETITPDAIRSVRPGFGLPPKKLPEVLGKHVVTDVFAKTPVCYDHIDWGE